MGGFVRHIYLNLCSTVSWLCDPRNVIFRSKSLSGHMEALLWPQEAVPEWNGDLFRKDRVQHMTGADPANSYGV